MHCKAKLIQFEDRYIIIPNFYCLVNCYIYILQDETLKQQMNSFLLSTQSQNEIANLDNKVSYVPFHSAQDKTG